MGSFIQIVDCNEQLIALSLVYVLMENKQKKSYDKIFENIRALCESFNIIFVVPSFIMTDFEIAIINAAKFFVESRVRACFFSIYVKTFTATYSMKISKLLIQTPASK